MVENRASSMALVVTALLFAASAHAQSGPASATAATNGCTADSSPTPCLSIPTGLTLTLPADTPSGDASGTFPLFGNVKGLGLFGNVKGLALSQTDITRTTSSFGPTWRLKTGVRYEAPGGLQFSASAITRRGYSLPIAMVQPLGSDVQLPDSGNASLQSGAAPIRWDTELRIRKALISSEALDLAVVGEVFNLLNLNREAEPTTTTPVLTSPTIRAGVLLGF
jgi:hypothetical protein